MNELNLSITKISHLRYPEHFWYCVLQLYFSTKEASKEKKEAQEKESLEIINLLTFIINLATN